MKSLIILSLLTNLGVLAHVCWGLIHQASWATASYGGASVARDILLSVYLAIGVVSLALLFAPRPDWVLALLAVQIIYKLLSPVTAGTLTNPVIVSNLIIAAIHSVTLLSIWRHLSASA